MLDIILTLLLILISYGAYKIWFQPYRMMKKYTQIIQSLGYKVLIRPYNPLKNQMMSIIKKGIQQGDAMKYYKEEYSNYDVIVSNFLTKPKLQFIHPDFAKDFYSVDKHYQYPKQKKIVDIYSRIAGCGLPFSEGKNWKRKRATFNKIFNFDFLKSQTQKITQACSDAIMQLQNESKRNLDQKSVDYNILDLTVRMFSKVMLTSFLGGNKNQKINGIRVGQFLRNLIQDITFQSFQPLNFILGTKFLSLGLTKQQRQIEKKVKIYRNWGNQFIKKRVNEIKKQILTNCIKKQPEDIIEALVMDAIKNQTTSDNTNSQFITNQQQIFQEFNAFFFAGTDTTSNFTQMMIYSIARHPQIQKKVRVQIQKYIPNNQYSFQDLKNLTYIQLIQKETTRLYGPGTHLFTRSALVDNYVNGLPVKKGTVVNVLNFCNHFSQKYFKNPKQFRPQRWQSQCDNLPPFVTGGFSAGARTCIGKHLVMLESKIALVQFIKRYNKIILPKEDFKMGFKFLYSPEDFETKLLINE